MESELGSLSGLRMPKRKRIPAIRIDDESLFALTGKADTKVRSGHNLTCTALSCANKDGFAYRHRLFLRGGIF